MYQRILLALSFFLMISCASTYKHSEVQPPSARLDSSKGVLISIPEDGWYGEIRYHNSGSMTANAIRAAFSKNAKRAEITNECKEDECLNDIDFDKYAYYVRPVILHWEDRATEWSGKSDQIEIQIIIFDAITKEELANASYTGKSKWATFGGDHPQDLLAEPTNEYVNNLYE